MTNDGGEAMKWRDISKECPKHDSKIWVWDNKQRNYFMIHYLGDSESWYPTKDNPIFPLWAYVNEPEDLNR